MNEERDRFITESMGWCWHEYDLDKPVNTYSLEAYICDKCKGFILGNNDFSEEEDFGRLWNRAKGKTFLKEFLSRFREESFHDRDHGRAWRDRFADELYGLLKAL
ncbi:MAG: hypothetical protein ABSC19_04430 [Syntrophorhabdales bacterium]|jgi:hypothetical protein